MIITNLGRERRFSRPFGNHATLAQNLEAYLGMDKVGTQADIHNGIVFTASGSAMVAINGINGAGLRFPLGGSAALTATNSTFALTGSRTLSFWVRLPENQSGNSNSVFSTNDSYIQLFNSTNRLQATFYDSGNTPHTTTADHLLSLNIWYHVIAEWRLEAGPTSTLNLILNNNVTTTTGPIGLAFRSTASTVYISSQGYEQVDVDEYGWWSRLLTAEEKTALYNRGRGLFY